MTLPLLGQLPQPTPPRSTTTVRADELAPGDQLTIGETVIRVDTDGPTDGPDVVHVFTKQYPTWALPFSLGTKVRIYNQRQDQREVGG